MSEPFIVETFTRRKPRPRKLVCPVVSRSLPRKSIEVRKEFQPEMNATAYRVFTNPLGEDLKIFALSFAQAIKLARKSFTIGAVKLTCR